MKTRIKSIDLALIVMLAILTCVSCTTSKVESDERTITGVVEAVDWDDDDNAIAVAIAVTESLGAEEEFTEPGYVWIIHNNKGKEMLKLIDAKVQVTGIIVTDDEGQKSIDVQKYKIIEENSEEAFEEDDTF